MMAWVTTKRREYGATDKEVIMATILYASSFGSDAPTRASIPFVAAMGAVEAGHQPQIALLGEATYLMKDYIADLVAGVGLAPLKDVLSKLIANSVPIYV